MAAKVSARAARGDPTDHVTGSAGLDRESAVRSDDLMEVRIWLRLLTCTQMIERELSARMSRTFGMSLSRFDALAQLDRADGGLTMGELSRRMMVTHSNVTGIVDRLVRDGLVDRRPVDGDRRALRISLTRKGRSQFETMAAAHHGWLCEILTGADREGLQDTFAGLSELKNWIVDGLGGSRREVAKPH